MATHGAAPRRFGNSLVWAIPDAPGQLLEAARRHLAWESLEAERGELEDDQRAQLAEQEGRAKLDLTEAVWRTYRWLALLGPDASLRDEDLGLVHSSAAESMQALIQARLRQHDELTESLAPSRVVQNWPKGLSEWSTKGLRDAVYASPAFTRLLQPEALRETVARGVREGLFGYAARRGGDYVGISFEEELDPASVEFSDDVVLVPAELARQLKAARPTPETPVPSPEPQAGPTVAPPGEVTQPPIFTGQKLGAVRWAGEVPHQK